MQAGAAGLRSSTGTGQLQPLGPNPSSFFTKKAFSAHVAMALSSRLADPALEKGDCAALLTTGRSRKVSALQLLCLDEPSAHGRSAVSGRGRTPHSCPSAPFPRYLDLPGNYWRLVYTWAACASAGSVRCERGACGRAPAPPARPRVLGCALSAKTGSD